MDIYMHARVLFTIILGLGVSRLLSGVGMVQHPKEYKVYWVHLLWSLFVFLYLIHFWWWEYRLQVIPQWTFPLYFFISMYAVIQYLLCVLLFPEEMADYNGFKEYFYSRRQLDDYSVCGGSCRHFHQGCCLCTFIGFVLLRTDDSLYLAERGSNKDQGPMVSRGLCDHCDSR
jgi:hypothetical protein